MSDVQKDVEIFIFINLIEIIVNFVRLCYNMVNIFEITLKNSFLTNLNCIAINIRFFT